MLLRVRCSKTPGASTQVTTRHHAAHPHINQAARAVAVTVAVTVGVQMVAATDAAGAAAVGICD